MACPQCSRRLLARFIRASSPTTGTMQGRWLSGLTQLPLSNIRWIGNTQPLQLHDSRSTAEQNAAAETISPTRDTIMLRNSASPPPDSDGNAGVGPNDIKIAHDSIRKELYEYLEAHGVDTELLRPQLDSIPLSVQLDEDAKAHNHYSSEPDWRQITKKHPRKKAQNRYRNDLARLTGQAPLHEDTEPKVASLREEVSSDPKSTFKAHPTRETGSNLKNSMKGDTIEIEAKAVRGERDQARQKLRVKVKASAKVDRGDDVKANKGRIKARATRKEGLSSPIRSYHAKDVPSRGKRDPAEKQGLPSKVVKHSSSDGYSASKFRSSERPSNRDREHWQIDKAAIQAKIGGARWDPKKKLSPDAREGIKTLNAQYPDKFTTPVLAEHFEVSSEAVRRILKSKWKPSADEEEERQARWDRRGEKIWTNLVAKGVNPPKKWRDMGIVQGQMAGQRKRNGDYGNVRKGNGENRSEQSGSEWIASLPGRMR